MIKQEIVWHRVKDKKPPHTNSNLLVILADFPGAWWSGGIADGLWWMLAGQDTRPIQSNDWWAEVPFTPIKVQIESEKQHPKEG